jgi:flagellar hook-associated protein 3 FlgL
MMVNKSMFPLQTGLGVISKMQDKFATLQMQMGTGEKASKLSEMARDLPMSLSVRSRLSRIEGFSASIDTVNLRLSFLDKTISRFDKMEGEARNSATQGQYGTNNINMATLPGLSHARLDEMVTLLNSDIAGRYLFGGAATDKAPLPTTDVLMNGQSGKAGFAAVASERKLADMGADGRGRLGTSHTAGTTIVGLAEDGAHPFGFKVSTISTTATGSVSVTQPAAALSPLGKAVSVNFLPDPAEQIKPGQTITMGLGLPDGTETQITLRAVTAADATGAANEFLIGEDAAETAGNFQKAVDARLLEVGSTELAGASTYAATQNFFNGPGEPVLRVSGDPATATSLRIGTEADTVIWYKGQSPAVVASNLGRLGISTGAASIGYDPGTASTTTFQLRNGAAGVTATNQTLTIAGFGTVTLAAGMTQAQVQAVFGGNAALTGDYNVVVDADLNVTMTERVASGTAGPAVTSDKPAGTIVPSTTGAPTGGYDLVANAATAIGGTPIDGLSIELPGMGTPFVFGAANGGTVDDNLAALSTAAGAAYTITPTATGLSVTGNDGQAFTITISGGTSAAVGLGGTTTVNVAAGTEVGIVGGNAAAVRSTGVAETPASHAATVSLSEHSPFSNMLGFQIAGITTTPANALTPSTMSVAPAGANPGAVTVTFNPPVVPGDPVPAPGETVSITLTEPNGNTRTLSLVAVNGKAGPGQFSVGADVDAAAKNFSQALNLVLTEAAMAAEGNPRQSVTAQVDDTTRVNYGLQANESGFLRLMRTMAAMSIETYPTEESVRASHESKRVAAMELPEGPDRVTALEAYEAAITADMRKSMGRFDAMAVRQHRELSEAHNPERGSIEIVAMEMGVALSTLDNATKRHTNYKAQLDNLLSDIETVNKEDVAMEILALQTRLQASYQATSMVSKLSLVNFL